MKYFTRVLYNAQQGHPELPEVIQANKDWHVACEKYRKHLQSIRSQLPNSMQDFCETSLHDGVIRSVSTKANNVHLQIDGCGCWGPGGPLELVFYGVKNVQGADDVLDDCWLYEEVHLSDRGGFEYHVLLGNSEFIVVADDVRLIERVE